ncbi:MAG TPA: polyprenyl diphosphate synthase, partial [Bacilli bacterium]|nr:polyprenyl diphosphate synthase [Bacilli bacterium]
LFRYLEIFFTKQINRMIREGCQIRASGDLSRLPAKTQKVVEEAIDRTKDCRDFTFNICLNYGGKAELVRACKNFAADVLEHQKNIEDLNAENFEDYLYTKGLPPVDLMIRTSGEMRTSNFLPWQLAYAEFIFPPVTWPDFDKQQFRLALEEYHKRSRRFGGLTNEKD